MVDLERRKVVDVLPDRSAKATGKGLAQHPGIEIVSRDRGGLYAEGARQGASQARQVADRFHLLQNLRQTIEQQLSRAPRPARPPAPEDAEAAAVNAAAWTGHGRQPALAEYRNAVSAGRGARLAGKFNRLRGAAGEWRHRLGDCPPDWLPRAHRDEVDAGRGTAVAQPDGAEAKYADQVPEPSRPALG